MCGDARRTYVCSSTAVNAICSIIGRTIAITFDAEVTGTDSDKVAASVMPLSGGT
jgi:hypothetical protein